MVISNKFEYVVKMNVKYQNINNHSTATFFEKWNNSSLFLQGWKGLTC